MEVSCLLHAWILPDSILPIILNFLQHNISAVLVLATQQQR
jgi:hypothetical protein